MGGYRTNCIILEGDSGIYLYPLTKVTSKKHNELG